MKIGRDHRLRLAALSALGTLAGGVATAPAAMAAGACSPSALNALHVPDVTIASAVDVPAQGANPPFCDVRGAVETKGEGAPHGSANFRIQLPDFWNRKLLVFGVGGFAGAPAPSTNAADAALALGKGYATGVSDTGHVGQGLNARDLTGIVTDARWALRPDGTPDEAKLTDYFFRATHDFTVAAKRLVARYYEDEISHAYFDGCSNGGRMALMEATRYPDDFDGIIAGDPFMSIRSIAAGAQFGKQQLQPGNFIPFTLLPLIDQATIAACDALDGIADGLIQNPAACSFRPESLACAPGQTGSCLSPGQVATLGAYFTGARDERGRVVYPGQTISDLGGLDGEAAWTNGFFLPGQPLPAGNTQPAFDLAAPEPWGNLGFTPAPLGWQFVDHALKFIVERDPGFNVRDFTSLPTGPIDEAALRLFDARTDAGDADDPAALQRFIGKDGKLLIYHGLSDPALTALRTVMFYEDLEKRAEGGFPEVQENVRLFLLPGMHHCAGGPGPNVFDALTPLENWVERGEAPDGILATKFVNDRPAQGVLRTMPLCQFPEAARFQGDPANPAEIADARFWTCTSADERMLEVGENGRQAGLGLRQAADRELNGRGRDDMALSRRGD